MEAGDEPEDLFQVSKSPFECKADALCLDALGLTYGAIEVFLFEDLKRSKYAILTESSLYLSPAQYSLCLSYYRENKALCVKFLDRLIMAKAKDEDDIPSTASKLVRMSKAGT